MKWKTIVNTGAERGFIVVKAASAITIGTVLEFEFDGTDDGLSVKVPDASRGALVAGLAHTAIASGSKGLCQVYGYDDDALILRNGVTATNDTLDFGDILDITSASSCLVAQKAAQAVLSTASNNASGACPPFFVLGETFASYATSNITTNAKVFIRCL